MNLLTLSNLFPRPDEPLRGLYNLRLFGSLAKLARLKNLCPVFSWRVWRSGLIRSWRSPASDSPETEYIPVFHAPCLTRNANWLFLSASAERVISAWKPDLIYAAWLYPDGVAAFRVAQKMGLPCWLMALGSDVAHLESAWRGRLIIETCNQAQGVICVSGRLKDELADAGVRPRLLHVVANGVDTGLFRPRRRREAQEKLMSRGAWNAAIPAEPRMAIFAGNLVEVKRPLLALEAWRLLQERERKRGGAPVLLLFGRGHLEAEIRRHIRRMGLEKSVLVMGARPPDELALWMNVADCLCLCSSSEGMPNVVLEALASGLPVVATSAGAVPEILKDSRAGTVVGEGRSEADIAERLAEAMEAYLARIGDAPLGERQAFWTRSWDDMARDIMALICGKGSR